MDLNSNAYIFFVVFFKSIWNFSPLTLFLSLIRFILLLLTHTIYLHVAAKENQIHGLYIIRVYS